MVSCWSFNCSVFISFLSSHLDYLFSLPDVQHCQSILGHALPLITYLLKPVQRIQRYHLLLEVIMSVICLLNMHFSS